MYAWHFGTGLCFHLLVMEVDYTEFFLLLAAFRTEYGCPL